MIFQSRAFQIFRENCYFSFLRTRMPPVMDVQPKYCSTVLKDSLTKRDGNLKYSVKNPETLPRSFTSRDYFMQIFMKCLTSISIQVYPASTLNQYNLQRRVETG